jgi:hypothetical protein
MGDQPSAGTASRAEPGRGGAPGTALRLGLLVVLGAALGLATARFVLVGSGLSLLLWGAVAAAVGCVSTSTAVAVRDSAAFGFVLGTSFMVFGYDGSAPLVSRLPAFGLLGLVAAACAVAVAALCRWAWSRRGRRVHR